MEKTKRKPTAKRKAAPPGNVKPKPKASPKTRERGKSQVRPAVDTVRASRDGHEFHEAWVARKCLGLLLPRDELVGIAVEGFANEDQRGVSNEGNEIADAVLYFGRSANLQHAKRVVAVQVKYSKAAEHKPFRAADAKKTIGKFARTYRACKASLGTKKAWEKLRFELVTNRPIEPALVDAIQGLAAQSPLKGQAKEQAKQVADACKLTGTDLAEFAARLEMIGLTGDLRDNKQQLALTLVDWSDARDHMARRRLADIRDMARDKAGLVKQHRNVIVRTDVLAALHLTSDRDLLPAPASFPSIGKVVDRVQLEDTVNRIPRLTRPLVVHAEGGFGKTVFMNSLAARLGDQHETILFDCFGMGQYRASDDSRHLPNRGLVHIANELACRGLCDPLLPSTSHSEDILRAFRTRLEQVVATLRRGSADRQLILLLDAIDNASEIARDRNQDSFPRLLLQSLEHGTPIAGLQVVVSARTHRRLDATGEISADELELQPFVEQETRAFLRTRVTKLTEVMVQVGQARSKGNARVLEHLAAEPDLLAPSEIDKPIDLDDLIQHRIDQALVEARKLGNAEQNIRAFLAGLATLPPPVPLKEFAQVNGMPEGAVVSFAADLSPLFEQTKHGLMFRDEPTETLIRQKYAGDAAPLRELANNLFAMQAESVYAATTLPDLLLQLEDGEKLFHLAFDERLPSSITGTVGQQAIRHARLRAAVAHAVRVNDLDRLVPLLVELSTLAAMDERGTTYLLDYPDLVVASADPDSLRRMFDARTKWPGSRHARLAIAHALMGETAEAIWHAQWVYEWREHYLNQRNEDHDRAHPTMLDMASLPFCSLLQGDGTAAARDLSGWVSAEYGYDVAAAMFGLARRPEAARILPPEVIRACVDALASIGPIAAAIRYAAGNPEQQRVQLKSLAAKCTADGPVKLRDHYRSEERALVQGLVEAAAMAVRMAMPVQATSILAALPLAPPRLHVFMDASYWTGEIATYIARQVIACCAAGTPVGPRNLLPRELDELAATLPSNLSDEAFRKALNDALDADYQAKANSARDAKEDSSHHYSHKSSAQEFISRRLSQWLDLARDFAKALVGSDVANPTLSPLTARWITLRNTSDYHSGGHSAQRQHNAVGERLLATALAANDGCPPDEVSAYIDAASEPDTTPLPNLIGLVALLASRPAFHAMAGALAIKANTAIEREHDVPDRAKHFARLGRAIAMASPAEAVAYFRKGLEQLDAIGSGDYRYVEGLMHLAGALTGEGLGQRESHTLSNICELNLGEERKFGWGPYGAAMSRAAGLTGLGKLARWQDRNRISLDYTLLPYVRALVQDDKLDAPLAMTLLRLSNPAELYECGTSQLVATFESKPSARDPGVATELVTQYLQNNPGSLGSDTPRTLARFAGAVLGENAWERQYLEAAADQIAVKRDDYNTRTNWRAPGADASPRTWEAEQAAAKSHILQLAAGIDPLDEVAVARVLDVARTYHRNMRYSGDVLDSLRSRVAFQAWPDYLALVARLEVLNLYEKEQELRACKAQWAAASLAVADALKACAAVIARVNAREYISYEYLSVSHVRALEEICGLERRDVLMLLIHEFTRPKMAVPASVWLNFAAEFNARTSVGVGEQSLMRLLRSGPARLASNTEDGAWQQSLSFTGDAVEATAGMIWYQLGSPVTRQRWLAAHSLRTAVRLGRPDVLDAVVTKYRRQEAVPFQAPELPFYYQHAQLWLLIAMARIALDAPKHIARHADFLEAITFDSADRHVLRRHFAAQALLACADAGQVSLSKARLQKLKSVNRSGFASRKEKNYYGTDFSPMRPKGMAEPQPELHLDYDFSKDDVGRLARLFRRPHWETVDALVAKVREHDADIVYMSDRKGRSRPGRDHYSRGIDSEYQSYGEHLAWHALFSLAGDLLAKYPVVWPSYEADDPWADWLSRGIVTHPGGFWLADGTDPQPLDTWLSLTVAGESSMDLTADPTALRTLLGIRDTVGDWLTIDGSWHSNEGVEIRVMSALASRNESLALAKDVAAMGPFQAYLPQLQTYEDDGTASKRDAPYVPWIVRNEAYSRLDETDALGAAGAVQRPRLSHDATTFGNLRPVDAFGRTWADAAGETVLRADAWVESDREGKSEGSRLWCRTDFVGAYLEARGADLLWLVLLRRYKEGSGGGPSRFWHTTAVIRLKSSLEVTYYAGRANELDESKF
ncbi:NACHT domain-containing protein [Lysobacter sp. A6]|uniref:NACHT domain-containing protein n=1 Tax=Noviluteimonas lactosilytica TaxID=2888523 RepID=A0ABS8JGB4_9GAMM|nr:NACHT domain-containing protein [Lysobacter lactosilyticus]MCC8362629.1 NACHT domain-containing protein [Lysobacter lactosilyticus]